MSTKKASEFRKLLLDEPPRTDLGPTLVDRLQTVGVHSALADPTAVFINDLYTEGLRLVRIVAPAAKNHTKAGDGLAHDIRQSAYYLDQRCNESLSFLERVSTFLDRQVEEDDTDTEAFEKNVSRLERLGRLDDPDNLVHHLVETEDASTHGSWAMANVHLSLVKLVGIIELLRFEHVQPTTVTNAMAEIHLDITHRMLPGLNGTDEGRVGLLDLLASATPSS